jgi:hypothetical protein
MKDYVCGVPGCGPFQGPVQRGQPPKFCPDHRGGSGARLIQRQADGEQVTA